MAAHADPTYDAKTDTVACPSCRDSVVCRWNPATGIECSKCGGKGRVDADMLCPIETVDSTSRPTRPSPPIPSLAERGAVKVGEAVADGVDPWDPTGKVRARELARIRVKSTGVPCETVIEAYTTIDGREVSVPLDVESIAYEMDAYGGRVSLSWPATAVDFDVDVRLLTPDERVAEMRELLERTADELEAVLDKSGSVAGVAEHIRTWLKLQDLGRR